MKRSLSSPISMPFPFLLLLTTAAFVMIGTGPALAHVKWAVEVGQVPSAPIDPLFRQLTLVNAGLGLLTVLVLAGLVLLSFKLKRRTQARGSEGKPAYAERLARLQPFVSTVLSVTLGVSLIVSGAGEYLMAPELGLPDGLHGLAGVQLVLGGCLILGFLTRLAAAAVAVLYLGGVLVFGLAMVDYVVTVGVALYLVATGRGAWGLDSVGVLKSWDSRLSFLRFKACPMCLLRVAAGITLIWLGVDKWWHPDWSFAVIEAHHLPLFGFSKEMFVFGAGLVETAVGLGILLGTVVRLIGVVLALLFSLTAAVFQGEILGHVVLFGVVFAFLIRSGGAWEVADLIFARLEPAAGRSR